MSWRRIPSTSHLFLVGGDDADVVVGDGRGGRGDEGLKIPHHLDGLDRVEPRRAVSLTQVLTLTHTHTRTRILGTSFRYCRYYVLDALAYLISCT